MGGGGGRLSQAGEGDESFKTDRGARERGEVRACLHSAAFVLRGRGRAPRFSSPARPPLRCSEFRVASEAFLEQSCRVFYKRASDVQQPRPVGGSPCSWGAGRLRTARCQALGCPLLSATPLSRTKGTRRPREPGSSQRPMPGLSGTMSSVRCGRQPRLLARACLSV